MPEAQKKNNTGILFGVVGLIIVAAIAAFVFLSGNDDAIDDSSRTAVVTPVQNNQNQEEQTAQSDSAAEAQSVSNTEPAAAQDAGEAINIGEGIQVEPGNPVVARVDGKEITRVDVYRFIQTMPANIQQLPAAAVYPMALEQVVNTRIVQNKAEESDVQNTEAFKVELEMAKQQLERNIYLQNQVNNKITDSKLESAYKDYMNNVPEVEERRARHILLEDESKAKAVIEKLNNNGDFVELAKELSVGPTAPKGGDLGYFAKGEMVPEFSDKVFSMKKGDVTSEPVKTQFGYHVIMLEDTRERPKPTMEQLKPALEAEIRRELLTEMMQDWRESVKIEQFDINGQPLKEGANALGIVPSTATN